MVKQKTPTQDNPKKRAVIYCRTSGKDRTSIASQKETTKKFIEDNKWKFIRHYVDKHKSGAKIAGRDNFQLMMRDAAKDKFDIIVVYDTTRFARDGCDILSTAKFLSQTFGIHIVDSKGQFDSRDHHKVITNFMFAGSSEQERLSIMERTIGGRIKNAEKGIPWNGKWPYGRSYDEKKGWYVNDEGRELKKILTRYADGESAKALALEYHKPSSVSITRLVRESRLTGVYKIPFNSPEIGINKEVPVPGIPEVIPATLMKRVKARLAHNKIWNKQHQREYRLTGFLYCQHCGRPLHAQDQQGTVYYRHGNYYADDREKQCPYKSIRADVIEPRALDYLYGFFLDEPAYKKAVRAAMPSDKDRKALEKDIRKNDRRIAQAKAQISNLVDAVAEGADVRLLTSKQDGLKASVKTLENRRVGLIQTLSNMPDCALTERNAALLRLKLVCEYREQDWRKLKYKDVRRFLHFLFSDNPKKKHLGIFITSNGKKRAKAEWDITFIGWLAPCNEKTETFIMEDSEIYDHVTCNE